MPTGARLIVDLLERRGVEVCFGLPGVHNLALWEALRESGIRLVGVRHEQAAAYAADGYARASGRLGVALTTTGPGAANTLGAVGEAWAARSPVLVIATDIPSTLRRPGVYRGVLHETTDQAAMFAPVVKAAHRALSRDAVAPPAAAALADAEAAPHRPVYLEVATDLLGADVEPADATDPPATLRARRRRARRRRRAPRRRRAAADLGRHRRPRRRPPAGASSPSASPPPCSPPTARPACSRRTTRASSGCPLTSPPPARCGTRPTSSSASAPTSTACRPRTSRCRSRPRSWRSTSTPRTRARTTPPTCSSRATPRRSSPRWPAGSMLGGTPTRRREGVAPVRTTTASSSACAPCGPTPAQRSTAARCGSSTRCASPSPTTPSSWPTCASRATGSAASTRRLHPAACRSRSAGARSATPSPHRSAPPWRTPARWSPWRATAASCSRAASSRPSPRSASR